MDLILTLGPLEWVGNPREVEFNAFRRFKPDLETVARLLEHQFRRFHRSYTGFGSQHVPTRPKISTFGGDKWT